MKISKYNILFQVEDQNYIYNTLTSAIALLTNDIALLLESSEIKKIPDDVFKILVNQGFIVSVETNETACYEYYYHKNQYDISSNMRFVILPTYDCNLNCTYCYQDCEKTIGNMDNVKIIAIENFIKKEIASNPFLKQVRLSFYGGEPLLCQQQNIELADKIRRLTLDNGLLFESTIITNATLINEEVIESFFIPNDMRIQITIDGDKKTHDTRRIYKDGRGSYDLIYNSIMLLNKYGLKKNIALRLNIDRKNISEIETVLRTFNNVVDTIHIKPLIPTGHNSCNTDNCISANDYFVNIRPQIKPILLKYKITDNVRAFGKKQPCGLNKHNSYMIDCKLNVYKCEGFVGDERFSVGNITASGEFIKNNTFYKQITWSPFHFSKCIKCKLLPTCAGSCAYNCYLNNGDINVPFCEISESILVRELTQFILNRKTPTN